MVREIRSIESCGFTASALPVGFADRRRRCGPNPRQCCKCRSHSMGPRAPWHRCVPAPRSRTPWSRNGARNLLLCQPDESDCCSCFLTEAFQTTGTSCPALGLALSGPDLRCGAPEPNKSRRPCGRTAAATRFPLASTSCPPRLRNHAAQRVCEVEGQMFAGRGQFRPPAPFPYFHYAHLHRRYIGEGLDAQDEPLRRWNFPFECPTKP